MEFEWDPAKNAACLAARGIDFADAVRIFEKWVLEPLDVRRDYGELRVVAIGEVEDRLLTVAYCDREPMEGVVVRRIISARWSNRHERKAYQESLEGR